MIAANAANMEHGTNQYKDKVEGSMEPSTFEPITIIEAAEMMGVGRESVKRAKKVKANGVPELVQAVENGEVTVRAAETVAELPKDAGGVAGPLKQERRRAAPAGPRRRHRVTAQAKRAVPTIYHSPCCPRQHKITPPAGSRSMSDEIDPHAHCGHGPGTDGKLQRDDCGT